MYFGVLAVGIIGTFIARLEPREMSWVLFAMAVAQLLVPVVALLIWKTGWDELLIHPNSPFDPGVVPVFGLNSFFALLFGGSALLFRRASAKLTKMDLLRGRKGA